MNANAKWQVSEALLLDCGLTQFPVIPQLFYSMCDGALDMIVFKLVDDLLIEGSIENRAKFTTQLQAKLEVGTIPHTPGPLMFLG